MAFKRQIDRLPIIPADALHWQHGDAMAFPLNIFLVGSRGEAAVQVLLLDGARLN